VEKDGYASYEQEIEFTSATSDIIVELNYTTVPLKIYVAANGKPVFGALVYFNGTITGITDEIGSYTTSVKPGTTIPISVSAEGYSESGVTYQVLADSDNKVTITLSENIPTTLIGLMALGIIIVLLILILVVTGKNRRGKKSRKSRPPVSGGRDSL
jgi:hypothetical protein